MRNRDDHAIDLFERALITGSGGMVGSYIDFGMRVPHGTLDVSDLSAVRKVVAVQRPRLIIHLAAATNLIACEKEPQQAYMVNAVGTYNVALVAREVGAKLVYVSTSAVFDGVKEAPYVESDVPTPNTQYGHSKYLGELAVAGLLSDFLILRTCWVFGGGPHKDHKFVGNIKRKSDEQQIQVIGGKRGSPTYGKDLVAAMVALVEEGGRGVYHVSNKGAPTRVDIAREIVTLSGSSAKVVEAEAAVFEKDYPGAGSRGNESITSSKIELRPWQDALKEYLDTEWGA